MRIAVNTRLLLKDRLEGIGWFTYEHLKRITRSHPGHDFFFIFDRPWDEEYLFAENVHPIVLGPPARHPFLFYLWFEWRLPSLLKKINADIFLSPDGYIPLKLNIPVINVIHDINFHHHPKDFSPLVRGYYNYFFPKFAKRSDHIVTVSEYSKNDIQQQYGIDAKKITVVYNGVNSIYAPLDEAVQKRTKETYSTGKEFFLFVGALNPRKNVNRLMKAFAIFKRNTQSDFKLVIVGAKMFGNREMERTYQQHPYKKDIIFTGRLAPKELQKIYASAFALSYFPYFEGFGIPIAEAMACGIPVLTSNVTSMPEVGGKAALLADPYNESDMADKMTQLWKNAELYQALKKKSIARSSLFNWDSAAKKMWNVIEKTAKDAGKA